MSTEATINESLQNSCTRREFVKQAVTGLGTFAMGTFAIQLLTSCTSSNPTGPSNNNDFELIVYLSLTDNQALNTIGGTLALGSNELDNSGLLLIRQSESSIRAFSRECTHNQCTIGAFQNGKSVCPCHGSEYSTTGAVIKGPAPKSLKEYTVSIDENIITIS